MFETLVNIQCPECGHWCIDPETPKSTGLLGGTTKHWCLNCKDWFNTKEAVRAVLPVMNYTGIQYAKKDKDGIFWHIGSQWFVYLHGGFSSPEDKRISKILLKEDVNGNYYGWLGAGDTEPTMIYPAQILVDMCFPYGPKVEEDRGRGRRIRLTCTEVVE